MGGSVGTCGTRGSFCVDARLCGGVDPGLEAVLDRTVFDGGVSWCALEEGVTLVRSGSEWRGMGSRKARVSYLSLWLLRLRQINGAKSGNCQETLACSTKALSRRNEQPGPMNYGPCSAISSGTGSRGYRCCSRCPGHPRLGSRCAQLYTYSYWRIWSIQATDGRFHRLLIQKSPTNTLLSP